MIKKLKLIQIISLSLLFSLIMPLQQIYAFNEFFSENDILFYNDSGTTCLSFSSGAVDLEKNETTQKIFQLLINGGFNGVQTAAIMGNMYQESHFNSDVHEVGNDIGYGLAQWSFGRRTNLEAYAAEKGVANSDVAMQIEFLIKEYNDSYKSRLSGTDFENATDIAKATEAWMMKFEVPAMKPVDDPAHLYSVRIPAAIKIFELYKDLAPNATAEISSTSCNNNAVVAGDIINTALNLAWDKPVLNGVNTKEQARETYQAVKEEFNPTVQWTDCGGFVATVMLSSGVDKNYVNVSVIAQAEYVRNHPEKYQIIENPSAGDLKAGDILILSTDTNAHTTIYTGKAEYPSVDASLGDRVPSVRDSSSHIWMLDQGAFVARVIQ